MDRVGVHGVDDEGGSHHRLIGRSVSEVNRLQDRYRRISLLWDLAISVVENRVTILTSLSTHTGSDTSVYSPISTRELDQAILITLTSSRVVSSSSSPS